MLKNSNLMNENDLEELINEENNIELNKEIISSDDKSSISNTDIVLIRVLKIKMIYRKKNI